MYCKNFGRYDWDLLLEKSLHSDLNEASVMHLTLLFLIDKFHGGSRDYTSDLGGALGGVFAYFFFKETSRGTSQWYNWYYYLLIQLKTDFKYQYSFTKCPF